MKALCDQLDRAILPIGTVCVLLGLLADALGLSNAANYLIAGGLLFHMVVWFSGWLEKNTRR